ncbi:MAG: DUF3105 domain-containing protein [Solirubrobacteraceae bacterium]|jgi:hypothetical protein
MPRLIERLLIVAASLAIAIGVIALLSGGLLAGRDNPGVSGGADGPGLAFADQGDAHLRLGELQPVYDSNPPTSGAHVDEPVTTDGAALNDYQLLTALEVGDVVLMYGTRTPPAGLQSDLAGIAPPFTPALAATGQAIILARRDGVSGVIGLAWAHLLPSSSPAGPALRDFAQFWLGRGARG